MKHFLKSLLLTFLSVLLYTNAVKAQKEFEVRGTVHWIKFSDAPNSFYHYLAGQAYSYLNKRSDKIAALHSLTDWQQKQQEIRSTLTKVVGAFPEKTPLNAKVTKIINKDGYRVENIIYESRPGYFVTSALFLPVAAKSVFKYPVVIYCSGHSFDGYRGSGSQLAILNLVKKGFAVFAFDPMGQGERLQYYVPETGKSRFRWPSYEHSYPGAQLFMTGNTLAREFIWDGIRAVDYLFTRKEVDPGRIGITGGSGGGTQSAFIAAFDERIKAAAPRNYLTNFTRLYEAMGPQDAEQNFFNGIEQGIDMADLLLVRAPKPALMVTTTRDMFPIQGAMETAEEVSKLYKVYGKLQNFAMVTDDAPHSITKKNREAINAFFQKFLDNPGDPTDQEVETIPEEELKVTTTGQLSTSLKGETAYSVNYKDAERKMNQLNAARKDFPGYLTKILSSAKELSGYREPEEAQNQLFVGRIQRDGYVINKYLVKGEGDYMIPYMLFKPDASNNKAVIYLNPAGKSADSEPGGGIEWFVKNGITVLAPDIIGTGELGPGVFRGDSYVDSVSYNLWFASMLVGRSIVGIQAGDLVKLTNVLKKDVSIKEIYGLAKREMSPLLLHAAAFDRDIKKIALIEPYSSYRAIVMSPDYKADFVHSTVPGAIGVYDLPDLVAGFAPGKALITGVTGGNGKSSDTEDIEKDLSVIKAAYKYRNASDKLQIDGAGNLSESLKKWILD